MLQVEFWITQVRSFVFLIQDSVSHRIGNPVWNRTNHFQYQNFQPLRYGCFYYIAILDCHSPLNALDKRANLKYLSWVQNLINCALPKFTQLDLIYLKISKQFTVPDTFNNLILTYAVYSTEHAYFWPQGRVVEIVRPRKKAGP